MKIRNPLLTVVTNNAATWSNRIGSARKADIFIAALVNYGIPAILAIVVWFQHLKLSGVAALLSGASVFTALLFGLLWLIFNTGITLAKDGKSFANLGTLKRTIRDLRANVTYSAVVALVLTTLLAIAASSAPLIQKGAAISPSIGEYWTSPIVFLSLHLAFALVGILRRFSRAFNLITTTKSSTSSS